MIKIVILFLITFNSQSFIIKEINKEILGEWKYKYSLINNITITIDTENHCPVDRMIFKNCNDDKELKKMPKIVKEQRRQNVLKNISCETYNNDTRIDKYFPVGSQLILNRDTIYNIINYGCKYKSEYFIETLNNDTLIIYDNKDYVIEGKNVTAIRHIYTKK